MLLYVVVICSLSLLCSIPVGEYATVYVSGRAGKHFGGLCCGCILSSAARTPVLRTVGEHLCTVRLCLYVGVTSGSGSLHTPRCTGGGSLAFKECDDGSGL